jgi:hypothetical protein
MHLDFRRPGSRIDGWGYVIFDCSYSFAQRRDPGRFVVRVDENLNAFLELEVGTRTCGELIWRVSDSST